MGKKISLYENNVDKAWYESSTVVYSECDDKDDALKTVKVVFKNGSTYLYKDVAVNDYLMFRESSSQGKALNRFLKHYEFEKLEKSDLNLLIEEYNSILEKAQNNICDKKTYIISAFPGCGKTTAYHQLKEKYVVCDSDSSFFPKNDFPNNYVNAIKEKIGKYDVIFISSHESVRKMLEEENIEYYLYYPTVDRKSEMMGLYENRGNDSTFLDLMSNHFETFINSVEMDNFGKKVCLENEGDFILNNVYFNNVLRRIELDK